MKAGRIVAWAYGLTMACMTFAMGYMLGSGTSATQVQVTMTEPVQIMQIAETPSLETETQLLDLNTATQADLEALPGIGPELARRILEYRQVCGGFRSVEQLTEVQGIGEKRFEALKDMVQTGGTS